MAQKLFALVIQLFWLLRALVKDPREIRLENLALRQQLTVFKGKKPRPRLTRWNRLFWVALRRIWPGWAEALILVKPETVARWHRYGFRLFWRFRSRPGRLGRPRTEERIRNLILKMARENSTWGAPRIHGELLKLGLRVSQRTVSRYLPRRPPDPGAIQRWIAFLRNHGDAIAAMDFFTVATVSFRVLYVWFAILHDRRRVVHFQVVDHPHSEWVIHQLKEPFLFDDVRPRYLIYDRDPCFSRHVSTWVRRLGMKPVRTAYRSPWQNAIAERFVGSVRRELLDHVVILNDRHLHRLLSEYLDYYHEDRCHLGLGKDTPLNRPVQTQPSPSARVVSLPRVGGLHHRYEWLDSA